MRLSSRAAGEGYWLVGVSAPTGHSVYAIEAAYHCEGDSWLVKFVAPAHWFDRQVRREYWETIEKRSGQTWKNPVGSNSVPQ